jgi:hypothetical protein
VGLILLLNYLEPGVFTRRLIKVAVDADITFHILNAELQ